MLDDHSVRFISSLLDSMEVAGEPHPLLSNARRSHIGCYTRGMGFVISVKEAQELIARNLRNGEVVKQFLNGEDLNSSPTQSPSRWVINFRDWPFTKAETYVEPMQVLSERVYPERMGSRENRKIYEKIWWQFWRPRLELYTAIEPLCRVLLKTRVSNTHAVEFVPKDWVYSDATVVFAFDSYFHFAVMQSSIHEYWSRKYASTLKGDIRYSPTDVFANFPFPILQRVTQNSLESVGQTYHEHRRQLMLARQEGLTATYNRFHRPDETSADLVRLRHLHVEMDHAVAAAYGWSDLDLGHGFHDTAQGLRYTISEPARREVLTRLLALNHERYAEEVKAGLHEKKGKKVVFSNKVTQDAQMVLLEDR